MVHSNSGRSSRVVGAANSISGRPKYSRLGQPRNESGHLRDVRGDSGSRVRSVVRHRKPSNTIERNGSGTNLSDGGGSGGPRGEAGLRPSGREGSVPQPAPASGGGTFGDLVTGQYPSRKSVNTGDSFIGRRQMLSTLVEDEDEGGRGEGDAPHFSRLALGAPVSGPGSSTVQIRVIDTCFSSTQVFEVFDSVPLLVKRLPPVFQGIWHSMKRSGQSNFLSSPVKWDEFHDAVLAHCLANGQR